MARARGSSALLAGVFESAYGTTPGSGWTRLPFVSHGMGEERGLIESNLLGYGREPLDPVQDVANNEGDVVVPVDLRAIGLWLKLFFGPPVTSVSGPATGSITFSTQPAVSSTITINGTPFTFVASGATGAQINIGASLSATIAAAVTVLNASVVAGVAQATYAASGGNAITATYDVSGPSGNAFTLVASAASNGTASGPTLTGGSNQHVFSSGATILPSMSLEIGAPEVPSFQTEYGVRGNQMAIAMTRSGLLNATLGLIAQGESNPVLATVAGTPAALAISRFSQATGSISRDGNQIADIVAGQFTYRNNLDKVETIRADGRIGDADPGMSTASGTFTAKFTDNSLITMARNNTPFDLSYGWALGGYSLTFDMPRTFLPIPKRPISGPAGIQAEFAWQSSALSGQKSCTATLINDLAGSVYA